MHLFFAFNNLSLQIEVFPRLCHYNVVEYIGLCIDEDNETIVFECMANGTLSNWLFGEFEFDEMVVLSFLLKFDVLNSMHLGLVFLL